MTLRRDWALTDIPLPKKPHTLPVILSREEVARFLGSVVDLKHRTILMVAYAAGLRVSEATHLKVADIDSARMMLQVDQGKGGKDRYVMLSTKLLHELRCYWSRTRPRDWLFPGERFGQPITRDAVAAACQKARLLAGIDKPLTPPIRCAMPLPPTSWNRVPICARSSCCWGIAVSRPPRVI